MSLKSTRERLNKNNLETDVKKDSMISKNARTPIDYNQSIEDKHLSNANIQYNHYSHKKSNEDLNETKKSKPKRKFSFALIIALVSIEIISLCGIYAVHTAVKMANLPEKVEYTPTNYIPPGMSESDIERMNKFITVAIFGLDSRDSSLGKGNNSDVIIIACVDYNSGEIKLISVYRDTYLNINKPNIFSKINSAYMHGGPQNAIEALNKNLDLNIQNYFAFNWKSVADGIDALGGIDLDITPQEFVYMNAFIHETCVKSGISAKNPAAMYIDHKGYQHLNGVQAVAYARLRKMDSDIERVKRQKKVIELCLQKAKQTDVTILLQIATSILPETQYYFDYNDLLSIISHIKGFSISETTAFPVKLLGEKMGENGDCIIPYTLESNVTLLHKLMFNAENYVPSSTVRNYSNQIMEKYRYYKNENKENSSIKESEKSREEAKPVEEKDKTTQESSQKKDAVPKDDVKQESQKNRNVDPNKAITQNQNNDNNENIIIPDLNVTYTTEEEATFTNKPVENPISQNTNEKNENNTTNTSNNNTNENIIINSAPGENTNNESTTSLNNNVNPNEPIIVDSPGPIT